MTHLITILTGAQSVQMLVKYLTLISQFNIFLSRNYVSHLKE